MQSLITYAIWFNRSMSEKDYQNLAAQLDVLQQEIKRYLKAINKANDIIKEFSENHTHYKNNKQEILGEWLLGNKSEDEVNKMYFNLNNIKQLQKDMPETIKWLNTQLERFTQQHKLIQNELDAF